MTPTPTIGVDPTPDGGKSDTTSLEEYRGHSGQGAAIAQNWQALPKAMTRGDVSALGDWLPFQAVDALQKLCHDVWALSTGARPRFFSEADLPAAFPKSGMFALACWAKELSSTAHTVEHPYNPGLLLESLASQAKIALNSK